MFIYMPKIKFIIHFFLNPAIWLADIILAHNPRIRIFPDRGLTMKHQLQCCFHFRLFRGKTNDKLFQKIQKSLFWDQFELFFFQILAKWNFFEKGLCQFLNIPTIFCHVKNQKKQFSHSWGKCWTDRRMHRQTHNGDFKGPSVILGSNIL